jgi:hypothetical protein
MMLPAANTAASNSEMTGCRGITIAYYTERCRMQGDHENCPKTEQEIDEHLPPQTAFA